MLSRYVIYHDAYVIVMISLGYDPKHWMNQRLSHRVRSPAHRASTEVRSGIAMCSQWRPGPTRPSCRSPSWRHAKLREDPMDCRRFPRGLVVVENERALGHGIIPERRSKAQTKQCAGCKGERGPVAITCSQSLVCLATKLPRDQRSWSSSSSSQRFFNVTGCP